MQMEELGTAQWMTSLYVRIKIVSIVFAVDREM